MKKFFRYWIYTQDRWRSIASQQNRWGSVGIYRIKPRFLGINRLFVTRNEWDRVTTPYPCAQGWWRYQGHDGDSTWSDGIEGGGWGIKCSGFHIKAFQPKRSSSHGSSNGSTSLVFGTIENKYMLGLNVWIGQHLCHPLSARGEPFIQRQRVTPWSCNNES